MERFDEKSFNNELRKSPIYSKFVLKWDRGNGPLTKIVRFEGFEGKKSLLRFKGTIDYSDGNYLDIDSIGGYDSIISVQRIIPTKLHLGCADNFNQRPYQW